jgi:rRNA maturation endonuclease Nob1
MKVLVLDTSAFITGFGPYLSSIPAIPTYTVRDVVDEIKNRELKLKVELSLNSGSLKLVEPSKRALMHVKKMAEKSGDVSTLSDTDLKVVAVACDLERGGLDVAIMTDDYGIQNVSSILGIKFTPAAEAGIRKVIIWKNVCSACKKEFLPDFKGECTECGSELRIVKSTSTMPRGVS